MGEEIRLTASDGGSFAAYLALPARLPAPAVVVLPEIFNANPHIRSVADGWAADGFIALAPDVFWRQEAGCYLPYTDEGRTKARALQALGVRKADHVLEVGTGSGYLTALLAHRARFERRRVGLVLSGGNIDPLLLTGIVERGMVRTGRLTRITVDIADRPGALAEVTECLAEANANIEEIAHQRAFTSLPVQTVEVDFVLQTQGHAHVRQVIEALERRGVKAALHPAHRR